MQFQNCFIERKFYLCEMNRHIYHKAVSQKSSIQFLSEDISFFTIAIPILPNVNWYLFLQKGFRNPLWEEWYISVSGMHTSQSSSSESFSPVSEEKSSLQIESEDVSFLTVSLKVLLNIPSQTKQKQCYDTAQWKEKLSCVSGIHVAQSSSTETVISNYSNQRMV